jgi:hypothetical protein
MCARILLLLGASTLFAAEPRQLALALRAQSDFDRVESAAHLQLQETNGCIQSQAAAISVAPRAELSSLYFRKGYCALMGAILTRQPADFLDAAASFDKSIETWPDATGRNLKNEVPQAVSSGLRILAAVSRLEGDPAAAQGGPTRQELDAAVAKAACPSLVMPVAECQSLLSAGRVWLGWIALQRNELYEATRELSSAPSGWAPWAAGRQAYHDHNYQEASARYLEAVNLWASNSGQTLSFPAALEPQPEMPGIRMQLGGALILAGKPAEAIPFLDAAIKANSNLARAIYYRARAEELSGRTDAALADYSLAARAAFATAQDLISGEAHLYRGIAFYRRNDYAHAENEFSSAFNLGIPDELRNDVQAWRHMAAVAGGACGASRSLLEESLVSASPFFPKQEARALATTCQAGQVSGLSGATLGE